MIRLSIVFSLALAAVSAFAGSVQWSAFSSAKFVYNEHNHNSFSAEFSDLMSYPCVSLRYEAVGGRYGLRISVADPMPSLLDADWAMAVFASAGDILTWDYFKNATAAIDNHASCGPGAFKELITPVISEPVNLKYDKEVYLAIVFWTDETPGYTWCKLTPSSSGLSMSSNATAFQEGLIVGSGTFAPTPEPTSAMLLLLGVAELVLRRKQK